MPSISSLIRRDLDGLFELWARWILNGCNQGRGGFASMLDMMISTRCQFNGGGGVPKDSIESSIEAAVMALSLTDKKTAQVLRVEYGAITVRNLKASAPQIDKAHALYISLPTYKRRLQRGRRFVADHLKITFC